MTDEGVAALALLTALTTLDLGGCLKVTDAGVATLASPTALTTLNLLFCKWVTDEGVRELRASRTALVEVSIRH